MSSRSAQPRFKLTATLVSVFAPVYAAVFALLWPCHARAADTLDEVKRGNALLWGGDQEGGGPYVYPRDDDPSKVTGFEVDLADKIAGYMRVKPVFTQGNWDKMPDLLRTQKIHVILNGYEWTAPRAEQFQATIPYYIFALQLMARKDDASIQTIDDLKKPSASGAKRRVGVLSASAAHHYMQERFGNAIELLVYEGNSDALAETQTGKLDATLQDTPIAVFYAPRFTGLRAVGEPVGEGYYVMYVRQSDVALARVLNEAIITLWKSGDLERIYKKYGIWDKRQQRLAQIAENGRFFGLAKALDTEVKTSADLPEESVRLSAAKRGLSVVKDYGGILVQSAGLTVLLSVISFPIAIAIGLLVALGRLYGPAWLRPPLTAYVEFLRGTPLMLQLYFIFFFLPEVGIRVPALATGILGLAINYSAYESEVYRAGLQSIPGGQLEAALSLGMSRGAALRRIIVPQAVRMVIPPVVNDFIALFKDTSVCSVVTLVELTKRYSVLSMSTQATLELMILTAVLYLMMSYPLSVVARHLEKRMGTVT